MPLSSLKSYFPLLLKRPSFNKIWLKAEHQECAIFVSYLIEATLKNDCNAFWFHPCNEVSNNRQFAFGKLLQHLGKINGVPDYIFMWKGGCGGIEFKAPGKKLNENQRLVKAWCEDKGVPFEEATSSADAIKILHGWGVINV